MPTVITTAVTAGRTTIPFPLIKPPSVATSSSAAHNQPERRPRRHLPQGTGEDTAEDLTRISTKRGANADLLPALSDGERHQRVDSRRR